MASVHPRPNTKFLFACFTLPDGRRTMRSTKETSRKAAQAIADKWEKLAVEGAKAKQAHKVIADIYRAAHKSELPQSTPRAYFTAWLARRKGEVSPATHTAYSGRAKHFLEWLADAADRHLGNLETRQIKAYQVALAKQASPNTANHGVKVLRVILEDARRENVIADNPAKDCGMLKKDTSFSRRPFTFVELQQVLAVADGEWRSMILFGVYTGQRLSDIAVMTRRSIDLVSGEIIFTTGKTGRVVRVPICAPLMRHVKSLPAATDPLALIHPRAAGLEGTTVSRQFGELLAAAGLRVTATHDGAKSGRNATRVMSELSFHSLRHTATSMMKNAGVSSAIVQDIIGHDSAEMSALYTHIESGAKREALDKMPDLT